METLPLVRLDPIKFVVADVADVVIRKNNNDWQTLMIIKLFKIKVYNALMLCRVCDEELYAPGGLRMYGGPPDESK